MKTKGTLLRRAVIAVMAVLMLLPLAAPAAVPAVQAKPTQAEINAMKDEAGQLKAQREELRKQLKAIRADKSKALEQKNLLEEQIGLLQAEINNINGQISSYDQLIVEHETHLADLAAQEEEQYKLFCSRVRYMEESGQISYWSILFSSKDFADLLDNFMMAEEIMAYDDQVMKDLVTLQEEIQAEKTQLEANRADQVAARAEVEDKKKELKVQEDEVSSVIGEIRKQENTLAEAERRLNAAAKAMDEEIRRKEQEMASQISGVVSESGFLWPLPGYNTLSSLFGSRRHPITGKPNNHSGIDIPAKGGTPILCAKSGVVITSKYNRSYGNYVVVGHSDGTSTLYAHMSKRKVNQGQTVKQGQTLGLVGTTGSSTGNHLHYEIRKGGKRVDPVNYYKDMTLYATARGKKVILKH